MARRKSRKRRARKEEKRKRKILLVGPYPPHQKGGHEYVVYKTAEAMKRRGFLVFVLFMGKDKFFEAYDDKGIKVYRIDKFYFHRNQRFSAFQIFRYFTFEFFNPFVFLMTLYVILRHRIDVVHFSSFHQISMAPLIAAKLLYRKTVMTLHSHEIFCFISSLKPSCPGAEKHRCGECILNDQKIPQFVKRRKELYGTLGGLANYLIKAMLYIRFKVSHFAEKVTFPSEYLEEYHIKQGFDPRKTSVIYNFLYNPPVNTNTTRRFKKKYGLKQSKDERIIMFAGHLINLKGPHVLINAFSKLMKSKGLKDKNVKLLMIGRGPLIPKLRKQAERLGIGDKVIFTGWIPRSDLMSAYALADIVAIPSIFAETFSLIFLEAFNMKDIVVASDIGALSHNVQDGETGFLVPPNNSKALAEKLEYVLNNYKSLNPMKERAYRLAKKKYEPRVVLKQYEELFR